MCESQELIVGFIYDELTDAERKHLQAHLAGCGTCRSELEGLRATRTHLALWSPPQPDLGFRMISGGSAPAPALPRPRRLAPVFALAAAAVIVLAAAAAIANLEIRYDNNGFVVRTGWVDQVQARGDSGVPQARPASTSAPAYDQAAFADLERRLVSIESAITQEPSTLQLASSQTRMSDVEMIGEVRQMLSDAQAQQKSAFAQQMLQVVRDVQRQHVSDIAAIKQGFEQYQGMTNAEIATSRDMFNQWIRASVRQEK